MKFSGKTDWNSSKLETTQIGAASDCGCGFCLLCFKDFSLSAVAMLLKNPNYPTFNGNPFVLPRVFPDGVRGAIYSGFVDASNAI